MDEMYEFARVMEEMSIEKCEEMLKKCEAGGKEGEGEEKPGSSDEVPMDEGEDEGEEGMCEQIWEEMVVQYEPGQMNEPVQGSP